MLRTNENAGRSAATLHTMRSKIESVGFTNVHEKLYRVPLGPWTPVTGPATMSSSDPGNPTSRKGVGEKTPDSPLSAVSVEPEPNWELGDGTANFNERMRDAGAMGLESFQRGAEGWVMWLLTQHGLPEPWTPEQVRLFVKRVGDELVQNHKENGNLWHYSRRVWAQKPYEEDPRRMTSASARSMTSEGSTCGETEHETTEDEGEGGADKVKKKKKRKRTKKKKKKVVEGETEEK